MPFDRSGSDRWVWSGLGAQRVEAVLINQEVLAVIWAYPPFNLETKCCQPLADSVAISSAHLSSIFTVYK